MLSESVDILIENRNNAVWLTLSGSFNKQLIPGMREKFLTLIHDGNRAFVVNLEEISFIDKSVIQMFLQLLNTISGKGGELKFIFKNETVTRAFSPFSHLFSIYPDADSLSGKTFINALKRRGVILSRKTGIRISRPVAIFLLTILCGLFFSLLYIINLQNRYVKEQQSEIHKLTQWKEKSSIEISKLKDRIGPLEQLGILSDTTIKKK
ncbi:MAG TPA: STAS domain-containing protein [Chitinispirillaceae bacterium]|nr:STAS domain-containing protein [Chitinispirillaceae bacterium]